MFPLQALLNEYRELGLILGVAIGFGFGFVLERAGFGNARKLAAQFYLYDMTVFKVMFGAIITASLGLMIASGLGWADLTVVSESAASFTYLWPMLVGGLVLGAGFVISGYCPGTSVVGMASGSIDAVFAFGGIIAGSILYGELFPLIADFHISSDKGHFFLYDWLNISAPVLAAAIAVMAVIFETPTLSGLEGDVGRFLDAAVAQPGTQSRERTEVPRPRPGRTDPRYLCAAGTYPRG